MGFSILGLEELRSCDLGIRVVSLGSRLEKASPQGF